MIHSPSDILSLRVQVEKRGELSSECGALQVVC